MSDRDIDDVLQMIGFGPKQILVILAWFCSTVYIQNEIMGFALLSFSIGCEFNLRDIQLSALTTVSYIGLLLSAHTAGYKVDSTGRRAVMMCSLVLAIIASVLSALMPNFRLILIFSTTGVFVSTLLYAMEYNQKSLRPFIANGVNYCNGFASIVLSLWGFQLHPLSRVVITIMDVPLQLWRFLIMINCIPGVIGLVAMSFLPETSQFMLASGENERAYETLNKLYISNRKVDLKSIGITGLRPTDLNERSDKNIFLTIYHSATALLRRPHGIPYIMATAIQCGYYFVGHGMTLRFTKLRYHMVDGHDYICDLMVQYIDVNHTADALSCENQRVNYTDNLVLGVVVVCVALIIQITLLWVTRRIIMFCAAVISALCGFSLNLYMYSELQLIIFVFFIVMSNCCISLGNSVIIEIMPTHLRGKAISSTMALARSMVILSSFLIGAFMLSHCAITFNMYSFLMIVVAILILFLPRNWESVPHFIRAASITSENRRL